MKREEREAELHDKFFAEGTRKGLESVYTLERASRTHFMDVLGAEVADKDILEYGCGTGQASVDFARAGARVSGIDISPEAVRQGGELASKHGVKVDFQVMDAQALTFPDKSFDIVFGRAILHHLDLAKSMGEITRVLRPGGTAVFLEPLGHNPVINLFRRLTPGIRTPDEAPLMEKDVRLLASFFGETQNRYFHLASMAALPFTKVPGFRPVYRALERFDDVLFATIPFLRKHAWTTVLVMRTPRQIGVVASRKPAARAVDEAANGANAAAAS